MKLVTIQKQTHKHRKQKGKGDGQNKLGVWNKQIQSSIYKTDKQGPTVQQKELYSNPIIKQNGKDKNKIKIISRINNKKEIF